MYVCCLFLKSNYPSCFFFLISLKNNDDCIVYAFNTLYECSMQCMNIIYELFFKSLWQVLVYAKNELRCSRFNILKTIHDTNKMISYNELINVNHRRKCQRKKHLEQSKTHLSLLEVLQLGNSSELIVFKWLSEANEEAFSVVWSLLSSGSVQKVDSNDVWKASKEYVPSDLLYSAIGILQEFWFMQWNTSANRITLFQSEILLTIRSIFDWNVLKISILKEALFEKCYSLINTIVLRASPSKPRTIPAWGAQSISSDRTQFYTTDRGRCLMTIGESRFEKYWTVQFLLNFYENP